MKTYKIPALDERRETVILANGQFPTHMIPVFILKNAQYIVCCDGAVNELTKANLEPSAIVGDCDSLSIENKMKYADRLFPNPDQETNDLTKAVQFCVERNRKKIVILGATGKREDHSLGNISLLAEYLDYCEVEMITDYGIFVPIKENSEFEDFSGQQVSIFSIEKSEITAHGLLYPVEKRIFTNWWQGTLNESLGERFRIDTSAKTIIYRAF